RRGAVELPERGLDQRGHDGRAIVRRLLRLGELRRNDAPAECHADRYVEQPACQGVYVQKAQQIQYPYFSWASPAATSVSGSWPSSFSRWRKMVRGSTPRSRAVLVRLPLLSSSTWLMYSRWKLSLASASGRIAGKTSPVRPRSSGPSSALSASTHA